jgi:lipopolysaccharide exporter
MSLRAKAISGAKWSAASMVTMIAVQFVQVAILARLLQPHELGLASMASLVATLADMFLDMGLSTAIVQRKNISRTELSSLYWMNVLWGLILGAILLAGSGLAAWFFSAPEVKPIISLAALLFIITPHGQQYHSLMERELMFDSLSKIGFACSPVLFVATLLAATHGCGAYSPVIGALASELTRTVLLNLYGRRLYTPSFHFKFSETRPYLRFGMYQAMDSIIYYLNGNFGGIVAGRALGAVALGGYNLATNCAVNLPSRLNPIFTRVIFPVFAIMQDDQVKLRQNFFKLTGLIALMNFPLVFGLMVISPDFVACVFGEKWLWISPVIKVLCVVGAFRCIGHPVGLLLMATGNVKTSFWFNLTKTIVMMPAIILGAHLGGALGVALALLVVEAAVFLPTYTFKLKPVLGPCFGAYLRACLIPARMTIPMVAVVLVASRILDTLGAGHFLALAVEVCLGAVVFGATFLLDPSLLCGEVRTILLNMVRRPAL